MAVADVNLEGDERLQNVDWGPQLTRDLLDRIRSLILSQTLWVANILYFRETEPIVLQL